MSITLNQAKKLKHDQVVYTPGFYNADGTAQRWRVSGMPKAWVKSPNKVRVPIKRGPYEHWAIDETNLHLFSLKEPARQSKHKQRVDKAFAKAMRNPKVIRALHFGR